MQYIYVASTQDGKIKKGLIEATSLKVAKDSLVKQDLLIVSIKEKKETILQLPLSTLLSFVRVGALEKLIFTKHFSVMLKSGGWHYWSLKSFERTNILIQIKKDFEIKGRFLENELLESKIFLAIGEGEKEAKAKGEVILINDFYDRNQILVEETRLLSSENILFRLVQRVEIPARGKIKVRVAADEIGEQGNIGPSRFTLPGLLPASQEKVYAESSEAITGGKIKIKIVLAEDIEKAGTQFKTELSSKNLDI